MKFKIIFKLIFKLIVKSIMVSLCVFLFNSALLAQTTKVNQEPSAIDLEKAKIIIDSLDKQFSKDYLNGDSIALAGHYTNDAKFGSLKGKDILSYWGKSIRNSIKNNTRNLIFTTTALTGDSEFLVELGIYKKRDDEGNLKGTGKYLVVWKQEDGEWKIYRDIGL